MQYLYPEVYKNLKEEITTRLNASEDFIVQMVEQVKQYMKEAGIEAEVDGRVKHLFSIYKKMITQNKTLDRSTIFMQFVSRSIRYGIVMRHSELFMRNTSQFRDVSKIILQCRKRTCTSLSTRH